MKKSVLINKEQLKQIWTKLNETNVDEIIPYIKRNKKQALIAAGILLALILLFFIIKTNLNFFAKDQPKVPAKTPATSPQITNNSKATASTFLPETKRNLDTKNSVPQGRDPFNGTIKLKGIMVGGGGGNLAILEVANTSYIAGPGTELPGGMVVKEVRPNQVILESLEGKLFLEFDGRSKVEKPAVENADNTKATDQATTAKQEGGEDK